VANISKYISTVDRLEHIEGEILSQEDIYNEYVMTRLRTSEGIDIEDFKSRFGVESSDRLLTDSQPARKIGNIIVVDRWLRIPEEKFLISDSIISELFLG
jgi:oxygen-independent coproporphyrinogen-3 oxidase